MNVKSYNTKDYENKRNWTIGQSKPNSNPIKPNFFKGQNELKIACQKICPHPANAQLVLSLGLLTEDY